MMCELSSELSLDSSPRNRLSVFLCHFLKNSAHISSGGCFISFYDPRII